MATATSTAVPTLIGSVRRALRLLEAVGSHPDGATAKQLAREAGVSLPTAYHLLRTLTYEGYLRRERGVFVLSDAVGRLACGEALGGRGPHRGNGIADSLGHWRDTVRAPVYFAVYHEGEICLVAVADSPAAPAVDDGADFRETAHAHAIGHCLLSQLGPAARRDHLDRHPVRPRTPYSLPDGAALLARLGSLGRMEPVVERQEYALGTVSAAVPVTAGSTAAALAISLPLDQEARLLPAVEWLRREIGTLLTSLAFSISI
ncbi:IclR family transcriptional regulator [Streptomyces paludis]|uniref:Transcriptional regulator n=1 Tax=Streptomyces paludis TaxID=2282738 RepID=A0A345HQ71_9ACTN|nr:helix-turn-helix domain-containing protein [Streptomyces paludis]AXG78845.1 transcriptional regulator [Streptomyces paludis]